MAVVDANYRFIYVDIGSNGRISDGGIFRETSLCQMLEQKQLNIPQAKSIPNCNKTYPYILLGDDAFALKEYLMKPFPWRNLTEDQKYYNYRLSRARQSVEMAFGILSHRFRVLFTTICLPPQKVESIVKASCVLHNFILSNSDIVLGGILAEETQSLLRMRTTTTTASTQKAQDIRKLFMSYFSVNKI